VPFKDGSAGLKFSVKNNTSEKQELQWKVSLTQEFPMAKGTFDLGAPKSFSPAFSGPMEGRMVVEAKSGKESTLLAPNFNPLNIYSAKIEVSDSASKTVSKERAIGGFAGVPKAPAPVKFDGKLGDPAWQSAQVLNLNEERQYFVLAKEAKWKGPEDLSGKLRFLWDDQYLYLGLEVTDDVFCNPAEDGEIWRGDGVQLIVDPCRESAEKPGRYDYAFALGKKGPQAWCYFSASPTSPLGEAKDVLLKVTPSGVKGGMVYEIAIPWTRLAPFKPAVGRNFGLGVIINEDDGPGRGSFIGWFGCAHSKQLGMNGDLILEGPR